MNLAFGNRLSVVFSKLLQSLSTISQAALLKLPRKLKLARLSIRTVFICLILFLTVLLFILSMRLYSTNPDQFRLKIPFFISCIATICAFTSVLLAGWSLEATEKALELTRITMRPFLELEPGSASLSTRQHIATLEVKMKNTGSVPANIITSEIAFFDDAEVIEDDNEGKHYPKERQQSQSTLVFPGAVYNLRTSFGISRPVGKRLLDNMVNGKVKLRFCVKYSAQNMEYGTIQAENLEKLEGGLLNRVPIPPQKWT